MSSKTTILIFLFAFQTFLSINLQAQNMMAIIPMNTATHTAVQNGSWFDGSTWNTNTVPSDAAIVVIPSGLTVTYEGQSSAHIFAIRVDGNFTCTQNNSNQTTTLTFDTFIGLGNSFVKFTANTATHGKIDISITPFDIEAHKSGASGFSQIWNSNAISHFSDGALAYEVTRTYDTSGPRLYTYEDAIAAGSPLRGTTSVAYSDDIGVIGRYNWDPDQVSIGLSVMGQIEVMGQEKLNMSKLSADALKSQNILELEDVPTGWKVGDKLIVTRGGNLGASSNGEDEVVIQSISDKTIACNLNLIKNHQGRPSDDLHCYVGNLTRNITFRSTDISDVHHRGHFMAMMNDTNVQVKNAAFVNMGRTDKSKLVDDFIWDKWLEPTTFQSYITALGQEIAEAKQNDPSEIVNPRGRYSIHLHHVGSQSTSNMAYITGNVIWGNPGWAITQHDSYATVAHNVVYDVIGAAIVSESGNELGFWDDNLIVKVARGHTTDSYDAALIFDDYLFSGQGLAMKGRGVICRNNVVANAYIGVGIMNMNPVTSNQLRMDATALATLRTDYEVDNFPLSVNGYSKEGDGVLPVEVALILENTTLISGYQGLRSIERDMGINSETRSIFDGFKAWGFNTAISIPYQTDYSFNDVFISGKNSSSLGIDMWKHSHNQTFNKIKMVDLAYGVQASKLVGANSGPFKTRNNGFTPWVFVDLETSNVNEFYKIIKETASATATYDEHGDNTIHLSSSDLDSRPTTFTVLDSTMLEVNYGTSNFSFKVDGIITDDYGSYHMGVKQAWAQGTLRVDYPERMYEFASQEKFDEYVANNGVYKDEETNELYFILKESLPNRLTNLYTEFPVRIKILNPPGSGDYGSPLIESAIDLLPKNYMLSRFSEVSQSSTDNSVVFESESIDMSAEKAVDGNNNGRINAQLFQRGLVPVGSISATNTESEPWFDMDLGEKKMINFIDIWNSVELKGSSIETPSIHFQNFYVLLSDTPFTDSSLAVSRSNSTNEYLNSNVPSRKFSLNHLGVEGRYIRIQAIGTNKIELAEVEVIGKTLDDDALSIEDNVLDNLQLYPNPTNGLVHLKLDKSYTNVSVQLTNILGQTIFTKEFESFERGDFNFDGAIGVYFLQLQADQLKSKTYKLLKKD